MLFANKIIQKRGNEMVSRMGDPVSRMGDPVSRMVDPVSRMRDPLFFKGDPETCYFANKIIYRGPGFPNVDPVSRKC